MQKLAYFLKHFKWYVSKHFHFDKSHTGPKALFMSCDSLSLSLTLHTHTHTHTELLFVMVDKDSNHNFSAFSSSCSTNSFHFKVWVMKSVTIWGSCANMFLESVSLKLISLSLEATVEKISSNKKTH